MFQTHVWIGKQDCDVTLGLNSGRWAAETHYHPLISDQPDPRLRKSVTRVRIGYHLIKWLTFLHPVHCDFPLKPRALPPKPSTPSQHTHTHTEAKHTPPHKHTAAAAAAIRLQWDDLANYIRPEEAVLVRWLLWSKPPDSSRNQGCV